MKKLIDKQVEGCFQEEVGESGTPHLQGCIKFRSGRKLSTLKKVNSKISWRPLVGRLDWVKMWKYCHKVESRAGDIFEKVRCASKIYDVLEDKEMYAWQRDCVKLLDGQSDREVL